MNAEQQSHQLHFNYHAEAEPANAQSTVEIEREKRTQSRVLRRKKKGNFFN